MKGLLPAISLAFTLSVSSAGYADEKKSPEVMIEEGAKMIFDALDLVLKVIPQYETPEILENGDIIIRRKNPKEDKKEKKEKGKAI
tara:strand:+ start:162 stop:419 length:258 start_codon:yes stop_codon:yes gene_type:complete